MGLDRRKFLRILGGTAVVGVAGARVRDSGFVESAVGVSRVESPGVVESAGFEIVEYSQTVKYTEPRFVEPDAENWAAVDYGNYPSGKEFVERQLLQREVTDNARRFVDWLNGSDKQFGRLEGEFFIYGEPRFEWDADDLMWSASTNNERQIVELLAEADSYGAAVRDCVLMSAVSHNTAPLVLSRAVRYLNVNCPRTMCEIAETGMWIDEPVATRAGIPVCQRLDVVERDRLLRKLHKIVCSDFSAHHRDSVGYKQLMTDLEARGADKPWRTRGYGDRLMKRGDSIILNDYELDAGLTRFDWDLTEAGESIINMETYRV